MSRRFEVAGRPAGFLRTVRDAGALRLPVRYRTDLWDLRFMARLDAFLAPGVAILDVGAGRRPTLAPGDRPPGTRYVALDREAGELEKAEAGSFDAGVVSAAEDRAPELEGRFDLVLSFFTFEHMRSTDKALENIRAYLRPGGWLLAQLAGAKSPFSIANRLLPEPLAARVLERTQSRAPESVFPAHYDRCSYSELSRLLTPGWAEHEVVPLFTGAGYMLFSRLLTAAYIAYEEWLYRTDRRDLAPYYLVVARR